MSPDNSDLAVVFAVMLIVGLGVGVSVVLGTGGNTNLGQSESPQETVADAPENVENVRPLAEAFYKRITEYYPESRVFITPEGQLVMDFTPNSESGDGVKKEMVQIALEYSSEVNETGYKVTSLSIVTGQVEAVVPAPTVQKHASGNLTDNAFSKTIEVRAVETETEA